MELYSSVETESVEYRNKYLNQYCCKTNCLTNMARNCLLSVYYVLGTLLSAEDTAIHKIHKNSYFCRT